MPTNIGSMGNKNKRTSTNSKRSTNEMKESAKSLSRKEKERKLLEELGSEQPGMNKRKKIAIGATAGVLGVTAILVPTVKYYIDNQKHTITMKVKGVHYETYQLEVKRGSLVKDLKTHTITGYTFLGFFKDEACTIPYEQADKVTKSSTVYCKYEPTMFKVTYPTEQVGYIVEMEEDMVMYDFSFMFKVYILDSYNKSNYIVKVNGKTVTADAEGYYIVNNVTSDLNITVENVVKNKPIMSLNFGETTIDFEIEEDATLNDVLTENETLIKTQVVAETLKNNPNTYTQEQLSNLSITDLLNVTTSGIYTDETCTKEIDLTKPLVEYGKETTIHTQFATLDKLSISDSAAKAKDTSISGEVVIPLSYLDSNGVKTEITSIPKYAFSNCKELTKVVIGNSVIYIGDGAFYNSGLTEIIISKSVEKIDGSNAFVYCSNLKKTNYLGDINSWVQIEFITPPSNPIYASKNLYINGQLVTTANIDTATKINGWCFYNLASLKNVIIGKNVTSIHTSIFQYCAGLESLEVDSENPKYHSAGNCIIETASKTLILGCKNSIIPTDGSVTSIGDSAFYYCTSLISIIIPESVTSIEFRAFYNCTSLTSVEFKNTSGWWRSASQTATSGTSINETDLANPTTAATYLKSTYSYQYWKRT